MFAIKNPECNFAASGSSGMRLRREQSPATTENACDLPNPVFLTAQPVSGALLPPSAGIRRFRRLFTPQCRISFRPSSGHAPHELPAHSRNLVFHRISCASAFQVYHNRAVFASVFSAFADFSCRELSQIRSRIFGHFLQSAVFCPDSTLQPGLLTEHGRRESSAPAFSVHNIYGIHADGQEVKWKVMMSPSATS